MSKSSITTADAELLPNPHPGEILREEFLKPMGLSQNGLARAVDVSLRKINQLVLGKRSITADTDLRLARYFGMSEGFFLGLQTDYDLMQRRRQIAAELERITPGDADPILRRPGLEPGPIALAARHRVADGWIGSRLKAGTTNCYIRSPSAQRLG